MNKPIFTVDLENNYSNAFTTALTLRSNYLERKPGVNPQIFIFSSSSNHLIFKRDITREEYLRTQDKDIIEVNVHSPGIKEYKWRTSIIVPENSLIIGALIPNRRSLGLTSLIIYDALKEIFEKERLKVEGNDIYIDSKKVCGIEEIRIDDSVIVEAVINVDYKDYINLFDKILLSWETKDICGIRDLYSKFDVNKFIDRIKLDYTDFLDLL